MESIVKSDIFFFITAICVFAVTALVLMILSHILHMVKILRNSLDRIHGETSGFLEDFASFRSLLRENQFGLKPIFEALKKKADSFSGKKYSSRKKTKVREEKLPVDTTGDQI
ncbi:MAG: hypothetical protein WC878_03360 [Candidatus Paceibacterota bacterium]|jgi:hypothetical protein